jgi:hypothetical protein
MSKMLSVAVLWQRLSSFEGLLDDCTILDLDRFIRLTIHFRKEIQLHTPPCSIDPPHRLPLYFHNFLVNVLELSDTTTMQLWAGLQNHIWFSESDPCFQMTNKERDRIDLAGERLLVRQKN